MTTASPQSDPAAPPEVTFTIRTDQPGSVINPELYGQFSEHLGRGIYEGIWVGPDSPIPNTRGLRNDVVAALKELHVPVLRWPGGCFADEYHWKDGIGPREQRPRMINTNWGGTVEDNHFGTHEFFDLCEQIGAEAYVSGNLGSGTAQEMMEWVEYITSDADSPMANLRRQNGRDKPWKLKYFGVGNESWGCGGNMRPEFYSDLYRRYNTFVKNLSGQKIQRIACGANSADYHWTEVVMSQLGNGMQGISLHYYTVPTGKWGKKGAATGFDETQWFSTFENTLRMDDLITRHAAIMDKTDPSKRIGLMVDEWGTWYDAEPGSTPGHLYQQNSLRDALVAAVNLQIFQAHADRVKMANIAQTVNVLQAMVLTQGPKMTLTPTYHVFEMMKVNQGGQALPVELAAPDYKVGEKSLPAVKVSASRDQAGHLYLSLVNLNPHSAIKLNTTIKGVRLEKLSGQLLTADALDAHNTFTQPEQVKPVAFRNFQVNDERITFSLPAKSVVVVKVE